MGKDFEQLSLLLGRDADAGVNDLEADGQHVALRIDDAATQHNLPGFGEFDGVTDKVEQDLSESLAIAVNDRRQMIRVDDQFEVFGGDTVTHHVGDAQNQAVDGEIVVVDDQLACLDLGKIKHVVDDAQKVLCRTVDLLQPTQRTGVGGFPPQQMGETNDGVHRCADFVAHVGQECALGLGRRFGAPLGGLQFGGTDADAFLKRGVQFAQVAFGAALFAHVDVGRQDQRVTGKFDQPG